MIRGDGEGVTQEVVSSFSNSRSNCMELANIHRSLFESGAEQLDEISNGWEFCINTTPIAMPEAFVSMMKGAMKSGVAKIGASVIRDFNLSKAS